MGKYLAVILPQGDDFVYNLDAFEPPPLGLANRLGVTAALGDEVDYVEHVEMVAWSELQLCARRKQFGG
jgi:hypothetical protein